MPRITIIGTGLIGTSIGLRLKASKTANDLEVVGFDRDWSVTKRARSRGALDNAARHLPEAVRGAALVILCTPVLALRRTMGDIARALEDGTVVTDTGSTKAEVMRWAEQELPPKVGFIGGHPMAGKTDPGPDAADAKLFEGARWVIVPSVRAPEFAVRAVRDFVHTMGATEMFMDAEEHDAYVAAISHLPMMAATAMFTLARESEAWPELSALTSSGFRDSTRLAGTEANVAFDITVTNRTQIVHWIQRYREALRELQERIASDDDEELFRFIAQSSWDYMSFLTGETRRKEADETGPGIPHIDLTGMLMGEGAAQKLRELGDRSEQRLSDLDREERLTRNE